MKNNTKHTNKWWHWALSVCPVCHAQSQMPVQDDIGEDCNLNDKLEEWRANPETCCGGNRQVKSRHAIADRNCILVDGEPSHSVALLPGQEQGEFLDHKEYESRLVSLTVDNALNP